MEVLLEPVKAVKKKRKKRVWKGKGFNVGARLRELRLAHPDNYPTVDSYAAKVGYSRQHLSNLELDYNSPSVESLEAVIQGMGYNIVQFFHPETVTRFSHPDRLYLHQMVDEVLQHPGEVKEWLTFAIKLASDRLAEERKTKAATEGR